MQSTNVNIHTSRVLFLLGLLFSFLYSVFPITAFSKNLFDIGTVLVLVCLYVFFNFSQKSSLRGQWLKPSNLFILAFIAVNFQYLLDYRLGLKNDMSANILHPEILNHCFILGLVGLLAFTAGYMRSVSEGRDKRKLRRMTSEGANIAESARVPLVLLHALVFGLFLYSIDMSAFMSGESYGESNATYAHIEKLLGALNVVIVVFAVVKAKEAGSFKAYISSFSWISILILSLYMILRLISGDRGPFVYTAMLIFYGYVFVCRKKYKLVTTILVMAIGSAAMSVIGIARNMDLDQDFVSRVSDASERFASSGRFAHERSISPLTEELGFSFVVNQTDVYAVEVEEEPLHPGSYLVISLLNGIPFVPGLITRIFHLSYEDFSSTGFANVHFFNTDERTWSIGTTIVGDFYLQFSVWGVLFGLFLAGLLMKEIDLALYSREKKNVSLTLLVFALVFASKCLYIPRSLLFGEMATFIMAILVVYFLKLIFPTKRV